MVPDLSIWLLQEYNVKMSWTEYQSIKIHDGLYDDANKPYFIARSAQARLKTNLPIILHHADHMASKLNLNVGEMAKHHHRLQLQKKAKHKKVTD
jgi:hypothetical protein